MNFDSMAELFNKFDMLPEEKGFVDNAIDAYTHTDRVVMIHGALANLFLAKQTEKSTEDLIKSNERMARATTYQSVIMILLTIAIAVMTGVMVYQG